MKNHMHGGDIAVLNKIGGCMVVLFVTHRPRMHSKGSRLCCQEDSGLAETRAFDAQIKLACAVGGKAGCSGPLFVRRSTAVIVVPF